MKDYLTVTEFEKYSGLITKNKTMKTLKITAPDGHKIDKEKSTFEEIVFKKIEAEFPDSVEEILNRRYYIQSGRIKNLDNTSHLINDLDNLSTKERAKAFLALMQLVELRDYVNGDWKVEWGNLSEDKYNVIFKYGGHTTLSRVLHFKSAELRDRFVEKYSDLIEQAKELL